MDDVARVQTQGLGPQAHSTIVAIHCIPSTHPGSLSRYQVVNVHVHQVEQYSRKTLQNNVWTQQERSLQQTHVTTSHGEERSLQTQHGGQGRREAVQRALHLPPASGSRPRSAALRWTSHDPRTPLQPPPVRLYHHLQH
jgi:hypothetical protein